MQKIRYILISLIAMFVAAGSVMAVEIYFKNLPEDTNFILEDEILGARTQAQLSSVQSDILPKDNNTYDIGAYDAAWADIFASGTAYLDNASILNLTIVSVATSTGDIVPDINNAYDLGKFGYAWNDVFASGTLYGTSSTISGYLQLGAASPGGYTSNGAGDLMISGKLEVDGLSYFDSTLQTRNIYVLSGYGVYFGSASSGSAARLYSNTVIEQFLLTIASNEGRQLVIGDAAYAANDFDHAIQTDPTIFIHDHTNPDVDSTRWLSLAYVSSTDAGTIETGSGDIVLDPAGNNVIVGGSLLKPDTDAAIDLGSYGYAWNKLFTSSSAYMGNAGTTTTVQIEKVCWQLGKSTTTGYIYCYARDRGDIYCSNDPCN